MIRRKDFPLRALLDGKVVALTVAGLMLSSCAMFRPEEEADQQKNRFAFLDRQRKETAEHPAESQDDEEVKPVFPAANEQEKKKIDALASNGKKPVPPSNAEWKNQVKYYDDFTLLNGDEELTVSLVFNSAPLLDVLPAFADVLGFNFVADSDLKGVVTLNLNSAMTRKELWNTFDRMLYIAGAGVTVEDSLLKIVALPKLAQSADSRLGKEIYYYPLKNSTAKDVLAQIKPFLGKDCASVELTRPNAILVCDSPDNIAKVKLLFEVIDQNARQNWPRLPLICRHVLPTRIVQELQAVLPVLGFTVTQTTDRVEQPGAIQLLGIDRLQMLVVSAATSEALEEIRKWVEILDSSDSLDQERVFVYKVYHGKAAQLAQALSVMYDTTGASYTLDPDTGNSRLETVNSSTASRTATTAARTTATGAAAAGTATNNVQTDQSSNIFSAPVRVFADGVLNRLAIRTTPRTYASIKALLDRLDVVPAQVLLQVLVVEVTLTESTQFGLELNLQGSGNGLESFLGTNYSNLNPYGETKQDGFTFLINDPNNPENKFGYIRAKAGNSAIKVISSPQLLVSSHTQAKIQVGSDVPIITGGTTSSTGQLTQTYNYENTGIILTITPQVTSTDLISLEVSQELSNAIKNTTSVEIDSPEITKRIVETSMTLANGRTMIIGGLIQEKSNDDLESMPILNNIPFLRRLFGSTDAKVERSEILVLITGYIVDERSPVEDLIKRYNEALVALNDFDETLGDKAKPRRGANKLDHSDFWR